MLSKYFCIFVVEPCRKFVSKSYYHLTLQKLMRSNSTVRVLLLVVVSFAAFYYLFTNFNSIKVWLDQYTNQGLISYILTYLIVGIPIFAGTILINGSSKFVKSLGLSSGIIIAIIVSLLFTLPMFIGGLMYFNLDKQISIQNLIAATLVAGFMEELYFRGFLFGQIFKNTTLGFIPAIFLSALLFAFGHLYQSQNISELIGIFLITFSGAVFFAWLYVEWNYNLWVPILTHTFMNLSWNIFQIDTTALGDIKSNLFRGLTIATAIVFTIFYKRINKHVMLINKQTLLLKLNTCYK